MKYELTNLDDEVIELNNPTEVTINKDEDAPADSIMCKFLISISNKSNDISLMKFKYIKVYDEKTNKIIFDGNIDEQNIILSENGFILEISGRSITARLLDNEALPQNYYIPSLEIIYNRHVAPYGFNGYKGSSESFSSEFVVKKGMSEWDVLYNFCTEFLGIKPRITTGRIVDVTETTTELPVTFSNTLDGIQYTYISENYNRYKLISEVNVRTNKSGSYDMKFSNNVATKNGVTRKRYIDAVDDTTSAIDANLIIEKGNKESYEIELICPYAIVANIGQSAIIDDTSTIGYETGLKVKSISYKINSKSEQTYIVLNKEI